MCADFRNFRNGHAEKCVIEIANAICARYVDFATKLKSLVHEGRIETRYVVGNHDYMLQLSPELRKIFIKFLGLPDDFRKPFQLAYCDEAASVFATHGHGVDAVNWHRES